MIRLCLAVALLQTAGCRCARSTLEQLPASIRIVPQQLDFGDVRVGQSARLTVEVLNTGPSALEGQWAFQGTGFSADDVFPSRARVGSTFSIVSCTPTQVGELRGNLRISLDGFEPVDVPLTCKGVAPPQCVPSADCQTSQFDNAVGRCVETKQADGAPCAVGNLCFAEASCRNGRCEGRSVTCDDQNPCTVDSCSPDNGCQYEPRTDCPGQGPCRVGVCATGRGCELVDAADGVPCGQLRTCSLATVCVGGACVERDPPDGFQCTAASPCQEAGRCINDVCVPSPQPQGTLPRAWTLEGISSDGGVGPRWADLISESPGSLSVSSYFLSPPRTRVTQTPVAFPQGARRCIGWRGLLVCGDLPGQAVSAVDPSSGRTVWTMNQAAAVVSELNAPGVEFFTARLAVLNENELLALYESRTLTSEGADPRCREFSMVVINGIGQAIRGAHLQDPIFDICNHPHSYGVAVDKLSNIYLGFSPSGEDNPATTLLGTTLFSFSKALQLRWQASVPTLEGAELMVGDGLLFQERSAEVRATADGTVVANLPAEFGSGVIGKNIAVGGAVSSGLSTSSLQPLWQSSIFVNASSGPLTLARWNSPWGNREVVLSFSQRGAQVVLNATELETGAAAFSCPVDVPQLPAMTAMVPEGIGVMWGLVPTTGGASCAKCDPRFARTANDFALISLPGLSPSLETWTGVWGDAAHGHHEGR
jgi:hypothetical protein